MSRTLYKPLGDNDPKIRIEAAKQMAGELHTLLAGERTDDTRGQVDYALGRLTKGLSSGRESARPGFATVLTEVCLTMPIGCILLTRRAAHQGTALRLEFAKVGHYVRHGPGTGAEAHTS